MIHGHSLGAAVSTQAVAEMCREAGGINGDHSRLPAGYGFITYAEFDSIFWV